MKSKRTKKNKNNGNAILNEEEKEMYACKVWGLQTRLGTVHKLFKTRRTTSSKNTKKS